MDPRAFARKPVLVGSSLRLEQATTEHLDAYWEMIQEPESTRLTGTHQRFTRDEISSWLASRAEQTDRLDLQAIRLGDGAFLGEAVVNDLDLDNESASFRISLRGPEVFGQGYGTEMTRLVVEHCWAVGLHRLSLEVYAFNPRAQRAYEKAGFTVEGRLRDALLWDGERVDAIVMSVLNPA